MLSYFHRLLHFCGVDLVRHPPKDTVPKDIDTEALAICNAVRPYTMTSLERVYAAIEAVRYVVGGNIAGAIVECGVWRGGSSMAMAKTLLSLHCTDRDIFLYDTFDGMPPPGPHDIDLKGNSAARLLSTEDRTETSLLWAYCDLPSVRRNLESVGYPIEKLHFVKGVVEETIPNTTPDKIAILRLDTDWYESTKHELLHLFPKVEEGGVVIIDDYGHWGGARMAVDEYIRQHGTKILLCRIDYTGRMGIKAIM